MNWNEYFIELADLVSKKSKDPSTKTGVVIVGEDNEVLSIGFNGFPRGVNDSDDRYNDRPTKYKLVTHAETNAIYNAARNGIQLKGATMYTNFGAFVCNECAKAIIQAGIKHIIGKKQEDDFGGGNWNESISYGTIMLQEAEVDIITI